MRAYFKNKGIKTKGISTVTYFQQSFRTPTNHFNNEPKTALYTWRNTVCRGFLLKLTPWSCIDLYFRDKIRPADSPSKTRTI